MILINGKPIEQVVGPPASYGEACDKLYVNERPPTDLIIIEGFAGIFELECFAAANYIEPN